MGLWSDVVLAWAAPAACSCFQALMRPRLVLRMMSRACKTLGEQKDAGQCSKYPTKGGPHECRHNLAYSISVGCANSVRIVQCQMSMSSKHVYKIAKHMKRTSARCVVLALPYEVWSGAAQVLQRHPQHKSALVSKVTIHTNTRLGDNPHPLVRQEPCHELQGLTKEWQHEGSNDVVAGACQGACARWRWCG